MMSIEGRFNVTRNLLKRALLVLSPIIAMGLAIYTAEACTGLTVKTKDGAVIFARSLEFGQPLNSSISIIPRGYEYTGTAPGEHPGLKWTVKYGIVGANVFGTDLIIDGINESGLHVGGFYLPGFAKYQEVTPEEYSRSIGSWELITWALSSFATVDEAVEGVKTIKVSPSLYKLWPEKNVIPIHYIINDTEGKSAVIEYVDGKLHIYDNPLGVITNSPPFDWQLTNLRSYVNLSPMAAKPVDFSDVKLVPTGQGSGMLGIPGDATPPSRFVRAVWFSQTADPVEGPDKGVRQALRLLNSFYLIAGVNRNIEGGKVATDITQWQGISDLTNRRYFFCTYDNPSMVNMVDLKKIDFSAKEAKTISMDQPSPFNDITGQAR